MSKTRIVFVHGMDGYGAAAWPAQHRLAGDYDCLFLKRTGFDAVVPPRPADHAADARIVAEALGTGGHVVAHSQGAVAALMAAVEHPGLVHSIVLLEPLLLTLTAELPATGAFSRRVAELAERAHGLSEREFLAEFNTLMAITSVPGTETTARIAARARLQLAAPAAPLHIIPGVATTVITGGWEPIYEEVAQYLSTTGARHMLLRSGHRPQDSAEGAELIEELIRSAAAAHSS